MAESFIKKLFMTVLLGFVSAMALYYLEHIFDSANINLGISHISNASTPK